MSSSDLTEAQRHDYAARALATALTEAMVAVRQPAQMPPHATVTEHEGQPTITLVLAAVDVPTVEHVVRLAKRVLGDVHAMHVDIEQEW